MLSLQETHGDPSVLTYSCSLLNSNFKEAHENKIHLDTEDPSIFQLVSIWLYTGKFTDSFITIDLKSGNAYPNPSVKESAPILPQETLFALWIFGDVRLIPMLCNHVINLTFAAISPSRGLDINEDVPRIVFQNTTKGAAMRKLFVEAAAVGDNHSQLQEKLEDAESAYWMKDFLLETLVRMKEMRSKLPSYGDKNAYWAKLNVCDYHQHEPAPSA